MAEKMRQTKKKQMQYDKIAKAERKSRDLLQVSKIPKRGQHDMHEQAWTIKIV